MKKTLYTFLVWNFLLFVAGLSDIVFYRNLTSVEGMTISWTQPALVSITSFLILLSIYYIPKQTAIPLLRSLSSPAYRSG